MTKKQQAAQAAREELDMRLAIARQDDLMAIESATIRAETRRLISDERQRQALARLEAQAQAQQVAAGEHEQTAGTAGSGFWAGRLHHGEPVVQGEPVPEPAEIAGMSMEQFVAARSALGIHDAPSAGPSRRPGYTAASNRGMFDDLPGYVNPRTSNTRVFESQLRDNRRPTPPGYQRPAATEEEFR